jgi:hypothetical protein
MPRINWPKSTLDERKALAKIVIELMRELDSTMNDIVNAATGKKATFAASFIDNFRAGRSRKSTYAKIEEWLRRDYPRHAARFDAAVTAFIPSAPNAETVHLHPFIHYPMGANGLCSICQPANRRRGVEPASSLSFPFARPRDNFF